MIPYLSSLLNPVFSIDSITKGPSVKCEHLSTVSRSLSEQVRVYQSTVLPPVLGTEELGTRDTRDTSVWTLRSVSTQYLYSVVVERVTIQWRHPGVLRYPRGGIDLVFDLISSIVPVVSMGFSKPWRLFKCPFLSMNKPWFSVVGRFLCWDGTPNLAVGGDSVDRVVRSLSLLGSRAWDLPYSTVFWPGVSMTTSVLGDHFRFAFVVSSFRLKRYPSVRDYSKTRKVIVSNELYFIIRFCIMVYLWRHLVRLVFVNLLYLLHYFFHLNSKNTPRKTDKYTYIIYWTVLNPIFHVI